MPFNSPIHSFIYQLFRGAYWVSKYYKARGNCEVKEKQKLKTSLMEVVFQWLEIAERDVYTNTCTYLCQVVVNDMEKNKSERVGRSTRGLHTKQNVKKCAISART